MKPEAELEVQFERYMRERGWFVKKIHGSAMQSGLPDYFCTHSSYRQRWVELKAPNRTYPYFTAAQRITFPLLSTHGSPIWVLKGIDYSEYQKLMGPENWHLFL